MKDTNASGRPTVGSTTQEAFKYARSSREEENNEQVVVPWWYHKMQRTAT